MIKYDLYKLLKDELGNGSKDLVTRPSGQAIRERIERDIAKEPDGAVVALDYGKQKRVKRPPTIDGMSVEEFLRRNADPIWLHQNEMWEYMDEVQNGAV